MKVPSKKPKQDHHEWFNSIAKELMNNWSLSVGKSKYRLTEIEFYYNDKKHDDRYAHNHDQQLTRGQWYFHGSGVDITFGDESSNAYGGILIRGIQNDNTKVYIDGSLKVVTEIFKEFGSISSLSTDFGLVKAKHDSEVPVRCARVGLNPSKDEIHNAKPYRFIIKINPDHKFKEKTKVAEQMRDDDYSVDDINIMFGYQIIK